MQTTTIYMKVPLPFQMASKKIYIIYTWYSYAMKSKLFDKRGQWPNMNFLNFIILYSFFFLIIEKLLYIVDLPIITAKNLYIYWKHGIYLVQQYRIVLNIAIRLKIFVDIT